MVTREQVTEGQSSEDVWESGIPHLNRLEPRRIAGRLLLLIPVYEPRRAHFRRMALGCSRFVGLGWEVTAPRLSGSPIFIFTAVLRNFPVGFPNEPNRRKRGAKCNGVHRFSKFLLNRGIRGGNDAEFYFIVAIVTQSSSVSLTQYFHFV